MQIGNDKEIFRHFQTYSYLQGEYLTTGKNFYDLAYWILQAIEPGPERSVALRKLLEAKEAIIRAQIAPGG